MVMVGTIRVMILLIACAKLMVIIVLRNYIPGKRFGGVLLG